MTLKFLLDTNVISHYIRFPGDHLAKTISDRAGDGLGTSIIVVAELRYGCRRVASKRLEEGVEAALGLLEISSWSDPADRHYADIRAGLEKIGTPIGQNDLLIAAHAMALDAILVTDNVKEFSRVPGLKSENWVRA